MRVPRAVRAPVVVVAGVVVLSVLVAVLLAATGALGLWSPAPVDPWRTTARVVVGAPCDQAGAFEEVLYARGGALDRARLDACGHVPGEPVDIAVTDDPVVHLAAARSGATTDARPVGVVLSVFAGVAGAGYVVLWRRPDDRRGQ